MLEKRYSLTATEKEAVRSRLAWALAKRPEVVFAYLHGSFLTEGPCGDVDVALFLADEGPWATAPWRYEAELSLELERLVGLPVDVHLLNLASPAFRYHATSGQVLLSRDEPRRYAFLEETWRQYFDYQPYVSQFLRDVLHG